MLKITYLYTNVGLLVYEDLVLSGVTNKNTKPLSINTRTYSTPQEAKLKYYSDKINELTVNKDKLLKKLDKINKDIDKHNLELTMCLGDDIDLMI